MKAITIFIFLLTFLLIPVASTAEEYVNTASIFEMSVSVRVIGMGGAFIAVADDEAAVFYNPAGLPQLSTTSFSSMVTHPFEAYSFGTLVAAEPRWGVKLLIIDSGTQEKRDLYANPIGTFRFVETGWLLSGGFSLGRLSLGLQGKMYALASPTQGAGFSLTPSLLFEDGPRTYGVVWQNLLSRDIRFSSGHTEPWIRNLAFGVSWQVGTTLVSMDFTEQLITRGDMASVRVGYENTYCYPLVLRTGTHREGTSFGASLHMRYLRLDIAYVLHYALPDTFCIAFSMESDKRLLDSLTRPIRWVGSLMGR
jgi:hypothetical protein